MTSLLLARDRMIPATPSLSGILPSGGLQRGTTVLVRAGEGTSRPSGATTLALELVAGVSAAGHVCAAVGVADLGLLAAAEHGIALDRLLIVASPGPPGRWQQVVACMLDAAGAVLFSPACAVRPADARRLSVRARDRGSIFIVLDPLGRFKEPVDLRCSVTSSRWSGIGTGHGLLAEQQIEVEVSGRGAAGRPRRSVLSLSA